LLINAGAVATVLLLRNVLMSLIVFGVVAFDLYWFYVRYHHKRRPRYPLVPPEGRGDVYMPRTNIPRPIYADLRGMKEKKRKFEKIRRMMRRRK
jgi:hypothetical protein